MRSITTFILVILVTSGLFGQSTRNVPSQYATIQSAIDSSANGDTVLVAPGTYFENLNPNGKGITIASSYLQDGDTSHITHTVVDGQMKAPVLTLSSGEDSTFKIVGFTLRNGWCGIYIPYANNPQFIKLIVRDNGAIYEGSGLYASCTSGTRALIISKCVFTNNNNAPYAVSICNIHCPNFVQISDTRIINNSCTQAALYCNGNEFHLTNVVIADNICAAIAFTNVQRGLELRQVTVLNNQGVGLYGGNNIYQSIINVRNSIFFNQGVYEFNVGNVSPGTIFNISNSTVNNGVNSIAGQVTTVKNLDTATIFNVHPILTSTRGLSDYSPGIGLGSLQYSTSTDLDGNLRPNPPGSNPDVGAYENSLAVPLHNAMIYVSIAGNDTGSVGLSSKPFRSIQVAIKYSINGDTVLVLPGTYIENLDYGGRNIVLLSRDGARSTILKPANNGVALVWFHTNENSNARLTGFTLRDGGSIRGSALKMNFSHPIIDKCIITNSAGEAAIHFYYTAALLTNCLIYKNTSYNPFFYDPSDTPPQIINCTITANAGYGTGSNGMSYIPVFRNCILYGNVLQGAFGNFSIDHSLVQGGFAGTSNIDTDPLFLNKTVDDYSLSDFSPAIGAGTTNGAPAIDINNNPRPLPANSNPDLGAIENSRGHPKLQSPILSSKANGSLYQPISVVLTWNPVYGATQYRFQTSQDSSFSSLILKDTLLTDTMKSVGPLQFDTTYYWRVSSLGQWDTSAWSSVWHFRTIIQAPQIPLLVSPISGSVNQAIMPTLIWNAQVRASAYHLQLATDSSFDSLVVDDTSLTTTSRQVGPLTNNTAHYWRVNARNTGGTSAYSSVWKFTTMLATPTLVSPANQAMNLGVRPTLNWNAIAGAATYRVQVATDSLFSNLVVNDSTPISTSKQLDSLAYSTAYYWRVNATNANGTSLFSAVYRFTTIIQAPSIPVLVSPIDGTSNQPLTVTLVWNAATRASSYRVQVATDTLFSNLVVNDSTLTTTSRQASSLALSSMYLWHVNSTNVGGKSQFSATWKFTTTAPVPSITTTIAGNKKITISWTLAGATNIVRYRIYRGIASGSLALIDSVNTPTTTYQNTGLSNGQGYYYEVTAVNQYQAESSFSNEVSAVPFNIPPKAVTLNNIIDSNTGKVVYRSYTFSSSGSSDADGTVDSVFWYINDVFKSDSSSITYQFGPGTTKIRLIVQDNDGAKDTSSAVVSRAYFLKKLNGPVYSGVSLLGDDIMYTVASGDAIYKMHADGSIDYPLQVGGAVRSSSSIAYDTTVYIASSDKNLYAFSKNGTQLWPALAMGAELSTTPTIDSISNRLYLGVTNRNFQAINRSNGTVAWSYFTDAPIQQSAVVTNDRRLIFSTLKGTVYGFDLSNLPSPIVPSWTLAIGDTISNSPAIDQDGNFYVGTSNGKIEKIMMNKVQPGMVIWQTLLGGSLNASSVIDANGTLYIGSSNGNMFAVNSTTGAIKWEFTTSGAIRSTAAISNSGNIYFGNDAGAVFALDSLKNLKWYYQDSSSVVAPVLTQNGIVYFGTIGGKLIGVYDADTIGTRNSLAKANSSGTTGRFPVWGTFQGNNQRTGVQIGTPTTNVPSVNNYIPGEYKLSQNYPNPFNPSTTLSYGLPTRSQVRLLVYNILGQVVADLVNAEQAAGWNQVLWNANMPTGLYFCRLEAFSVNDPSKRFVDVKKMILLK